MKIVDFTKDFLEEAEVLAGVQYEEERQWVPALPDLKDLRRKGLLPRLCSPDGESLAASGLGAAAFQDGRLVGYLCAVGMFDSAFGSTDVTGVFSPMWANAAVKENREQIYAALYQYAARKWVDAGAVSHGICLYAHDRAAQQQFYCYSFGLRCMDGVRLLEPVECAECIGYSFYELPPEECAKVYPLEVSLHEHYRQSPFFMNRAVVSRRDFLENGGSGKVRFFAAEYEGEICAYLKLEEEGETFLTQDTGYMHITGAFCLPVHRGKGVYQNLLNLVIRVLKEEGFQKIGVDFESINPTAYGFWRKYFGIYTHGAVRRIDERILMKEL